MLVGLILWDGLKGRWLTPWWPTLGVAIHLTMFQAPTWPGVVAAHSWRTFPPARRIDTGPGAGSPSFDKLRIRFSTAEPANGLHPEPVEG